MNNSKLVEAIAELEAQREIIDNAIVHLHKALKALTGEPQNHEVTRPSVATIRPAGHSYIDQAIEAILGGGHALHINAILDHITKIRGERPARASVESGILRHISKYGDSSRLIKTAPSTFDVRHSLTIAG
jgi:hypothetical protein